ncbi:MAG: diacylglycerol/lipid kinase family protein [Thermocrispum sp.]
MRAVLVVNPQATATTAGGRDVLAHALASEVKLEVAETTHRGHAAAIAAAAAADGVRMVVAHGGDGTVNEVVNGLLGAVHDTRDPRDAPLFAVVPGGSANVFARAAGYPRDPVEATHVLLDALISGRRRSVGLGRADQRWFTFSAGMGWDADVVEGVDNKRGKRTGTALYMRVATAVYLRPPHGRHTLRLELPGEDPVDVRTAFVSNTDPWSYLGERPIRLNPGCSFDGGLGLFALRKLGLFGVLGHLRQALNDKGRQRGRHLIRADDVPSLSIRSEKPVNLQVDGDLVGERTSVEFTSVGHALTVVV